MRYMDKETYTKEEILTRFWMNGLNVEALKKLTK
jgi:hypothetical protein